MRGEHSANSDIDIAVDWGDPADDNTVNWWTFNNADEFTSINTKLPGRLHVLEPDDTEFQVKVRSGPVVHRRGNVICVWLKAKE